MVFLNQKIILFHFVPFYKQRLRGHCVQGPVLPSALAYPFSLETQLAQPFIFLFWNKEQGVITMKITV